MRGIIMRMTVEEMREKYPNTCIGITDIEYDDTENVVSADVKYTNKTEEELILMSISHTGICPYYTSLSEGSELAGLVL